MTRTGQKHIFWLRWRETSFFVSNYLHASPPSFIGPNCYWPLSLILWHHLRLHLTSYLNSYYPLNQLFISDNQWEERKRRSYSESNDYDDEIQIGKHWWHTSRCVWTRSYLWDWRWIQCVQGGGGDTSKYENVESPLGWYYGSDHQILNPSFTKSGEQQLTPRYELWVPQESNISWFKYGNLLGNIFSIS